MALIPRPGRQATAFLMAFLIASSSFSWSIARAQTAEVVSGAVLILEFDEPTGPYLDSSGNNLNALCIGGAVNCPTATTGATEGSDAALFSATSKVEIPDSSLLNTNPAFIARSYVYQMKLADPAPTQVAYKEGGTTTWVSMYIAAGILYAGHGSGTSKAWLNAPFPAASWHHVAYTIDLNTDLHTLYIDGSPVATGPTITTATIPSHGGDGTFAYSDGALP